MSDKGQQPGAILKPLIQMPENPADCWRWTGKVCKTTGYGMKQWMGTTYLAHRWVFALFNGVIPAGLTINHLCRNRACVNPLHLEAVTQAENCRHGIGTKLTPEVAAYIKHYPRRSGGIRKRLATAHGVSPQLISDIWGGRAWADLWSPSSKPTPRSSPGPARCSTHRWR